MKRVMVNLEPAVGELLKHKADAEKRSESSYIALLVENDLRVAGLLSEDNSDAEFVAKVTSAAKDNPAVKPEVEKVLRKFARRQRAA